MTFWQPSLESTSRPVYRAIAEAIAGDVESGRLRPLDRLPTQRDLAATLGVAVSTVTRAYAEAERRLLISSEVGRGTFVRPPLPLALGRGEEGGDPSVTDLSINLLFPTPEVDGVRQTISAVTTQADMAGLLGYEASGGALRHREAGAQWLARTGLDPSADRVLITCGVQHAMAVTFATLCEPGDVVLTENLTYRGMKALANAQHFTLRGLEMDEQGVRPEAFEAACRAEKVKALYCMPTVQNPTSTVMPLARREEIAETAARHGVTIVEDDTYGFLDPTLPPLTALVPDRSFLLTGTSKSLMPGFRVGFMLAPKELVERLAATICATVWMAAPFLAEVVCACIANGTAERILEWKHREITARQGIAREVLGPLAFASNPASQHLWIDLPDPWRADDFVAQARMRGVIVSSAGDFIVGRGTAPHAVRVCLGPVSQRSVLKDALRTVADTLQGPPAPYLAGA